MIIIKLRLLSKILHYPWKKLLLATIDLVYHWHKLNVFKSPRNAKSSKYITVDFSLERPTQAVFVDNSY